MLPRLPDEVFERDVLKRLLEMDGIERTRAAVEKVAKILKKHPATIYRWIESYNCSGRLSALLRKNRADRGKSRLSSKVDTIIEDAIKKIYLTAEQPTAWSSAFPSILDL
jgi:putative transposase